MIKNLVERAKYFAYEKHKSVNHFYDGKPYGETHLAMVVSVGLEFINLIPENAREDVICGCYLHDTIEDCRLTANDIKKEFGTDIMEIVYALTNEKGKNRHERANDKYYEGIRNTKGAIFVKLCDRIANVQYSKMTKSNMFETYKKENTNFLTQLGYYGNDTFEYSLMVTPLLKLFED